MIWKWIFDAVFYILDLVLLLVTKAPDFLPIPTEILTRLTGWAGNTGYMAGLPGSAVRTTFYAAILIQFGAGTAVYFIILLIRTARTYVPGIARPYPDAMTESADEVHSLPQLLGLHQEMGKQPPDYPTHI